MKKSNILILFLGVGAFWGCNFEDKEITTQEAYEYNNKIALLWNQMVELDRDIENDFHSNFYTFFSPTDSLFKRFIEIKMRSVDILIENTENIDDLQNDNHLKMLLLQTLNYLRKNTSTYYSTLLGYGNESSQRYNQLVSERNNQLAKFEKMFVNEQNRLATKYKFQLGEE